jgi:hypothetical protein
MCPTKRSPLASPSKSTTSQGRPKKSTIDIDGQVEALLTNEFRRSYFFLIHKNSSILYQLSYNCVLLQRIFLNTGQCPNCGQDRLLSQTPPTQPITIKFFAVSHIAEKFYSASIQRCSSCDQSNLWWTVMNLNHKNRENFPRFQYILNINIFTGNIVLDRREKFFFTLEDDFHIRKYSIHFGILQKKSRTPIIVDMQNKVSVDKCKLQ